MSESEFPKSALDKFRQWHFWWLVVFSFLLIITFVYYLPTMFLNQSMIPHDALTGMPIDESQPHGHDSTTPKPVATGMMEEEHENGHMESSGMMKEDEGAGHEANGENRYHEENEVKEGLAVNLNISPVPYNVGTALNLDFFVNTKPGNVPVLASQLQIEHTKLMHVVGLRSDMNEYFHIHPEFLADNPSIFSVEHTFKKPGLYKIWSSIKKDGTDHTFGHPEVNVNGQGPKEEKPSFAEASEGKKVSFSRNVITGDYQVSLISSDTVVKNREVELSFDIHTLTGQEVTVENYLGAQMHLVLIKDDLKQFIHTHPAGHEHSQAPKLINIALAHGGVEDEPAGATEEHQTTPGADEVISFAVTFPEAGLYKAFAQFRPEGTELPAGEAILAEFWIQVEEKAPFPMSQWWGLLLVSVLLIAGLSWWVNNYLKVKPEDVTAKAK